MVCKKAKALNQVVSTAIDVNGIYRTMEDILERIDRIEEQFTDLEQEMVDHAKIADRKSLEDLGRRHAELLPVVEAGRAYRKVRQDLEGLDEMEADDEMADLAREEREVLEAARDEAHRHLCDLLALKDPADARNAIVEIRAGTGGQEAALFAGDLYRMYTRFAERMGWKCETLASNPTGLGGFKEISVLIKGKDVYGRLKFESGVHRVQRIPETEASGRIHTSAASVAVLPEAEEVDMAIKTEDLKFDVFRSSGPGGQSVNTTDSAVRVTHLPTGMVVTCQDEKSQHKNKAKALKVLRSRLLDMMTRSKAEERQGLRRNLVKSGDRSDRIRTYNFPQSRLTDHRIGLTLYNLPMIMEGELDEVVDSLRREDRLRRMNEM